MRPKERYDDGGSDLVCGCTQAVTYTEVPEKKVTLSLSLRLPCPLRPPRHSADSGTTSDSRTHVGSICIIGCALIASPYTVALIKR